MIVTRNARWMPNASARKPYNKGTRAPPAIARQRMPEPWLNRDSRGQLNASTSFPINDFDDPVIFMVAFSGVNLTQEQTV